MCCKICTYITSLRTGVVSCKVQTGAVSCYKVFKDYKQALKIVIHKEVLYLSCKVQTGAVSCYKVYKDCKQAL